MAHRTWKDVRAERINTPEAEARVAVHREAARSEQRAYRLTELRKHQGLTQVELADSMHISQAAVSSIERGDLSRSELSTTGRSRARGQAAEPEQYTRDAPARR